MRRKELIFLLVLSVILPVTAEATDVTRQMPDEVPFNSTFEVTLTIDSGMPVVVGINETIPDGFSFVNTSCEHYNVSGQKIAFAAINVTEIKYWVKAPLQAGDEGTFTGYWVDMLNESEGSIADTTVSVTPRTIVDSAGRTVTINKSIERIIVLNSDAAEAVKILGCKDKVVGIVDTVQKKTFYFPEISQKDLVGTWKEVNWEAVVNLTPDLVIAYTKYGADVEEAEEALSPFNIPVVGLDLYDPRSIPDEIQKLSVLLESEERASQYLEWYSKYETIVEGLISGKEKPEVFVTSTSAIGKTGEIPTYGNGSTIDEMIKLTGAINVFGDSNVTFPKVSAEEVLAKNPDVIVIKKSYVFGWDNKDEPKQLIDDVLEGKSWDGVNAVKNRRVYILPWNAVYGMEQPFAITLFAKIFHPEIDDINPDDVNVNNPEDVYREFLEEFMGIDYPEDKIFYYKMPSPSTQTQTSAPSGGGGGGGVYIPPTTTLKASSEYHESLLEYFHANEEKVISMTSNLKDKTGITEIGASVSEDVGIASVVVSKVSSLPEDVSEPEGKSYVYFEIVFTRHGTSDVIEPSGYIKHRISKEWLGDNNAEPSDVRFLKWNGSWEELPCKLIDEDDSYYYFRVNLSSFCLFAVVLKEAVTATETPVVTMTPEATATPEATPTPEVKETPKPTAIETKTTPALTPQESRAIVEVQWWQQPTAIIAFAAIALCFIGLLIYFVRRGG